MAKLSVGPVILIIVGILFLLGNSGLVEHAFGRYWPIILVAWGAVLLYNNAKPKGKS